MKERLIISIVSPVYRAEGMVALLVSEIKKHVTPVSDSFEIILVEDGSPDNSWDEILSESAVDKRIKGIKLSRNFGQHYAITAGLDHSKGEWIVVMDCDLQDLPSEIPNLFAEAKKGFDIVLARRVERNDGVMKRLFSRMFYKVLGYLTGTKQDAAVANFGIYHRKVIDVICSMREQIRYFPTMVNWVGFKKAFLNVRHGARDGGQSSYNFRRLLMLAFDILLANSEKPIRLIVKTGFFISSVAFLVSIVVLVKYFLGQIEVVGYTSLILSIWLIGGVIMMIMGVIGLYIGKIFQNVKNRPVYIVAENRNLNED